uniref:Uncharacterized protein n=1 Tax=Macrostomum lignano TaxID=282301 RepID=A0A1I8FWU4_9PLAT
MDSAALKARLKNLSVYSLSRVAPQSGQGKGGYICRLQTRPSNSLQQEDPFFSIHWAVLQSDCLLLFDSSISRSCSEAICLSGFRGFSRINPRSCWLWIIRKVCFDSVDVGELPRLANLKQSEFKGGLAPD